MEWAVDDGQIEGEGMKRNLTDTISRQEVFMNLYCCAFDYILILAESFSLNGNSGRSVWCRGDTQVRFSALIIFGRM